MEAPHPTNSYLLRRTYELYASRWKKNALITLPPTILTLLIYYLGTEVNHTLTRQILGPNWPSLPDLDHKIFLVSVSNGAVQFLYFGLGWILTILGFAAVANALADNESPYPQGTSDAYSSVSERLFKLVLVGLISYLPAAIGFTVVLFGSLQIAHKFLPNQYFWFVWTLLIAGYVALFALLCRFGLSIPYLMDRPPASIREAIRASLRLSQGYESYFTILTSKVVATTFFGYLLGSYVFQKLSETHNLGYAAFPWFTNGWAITLAVISEPFLFIGLTVLYLERTRAPQTADAASVAASETIDAAPITPH